MSVLLNTSAGDLVIDLFIDECPKACTNFLKLCQIKYYNNCLFYNVQQNFIAQSGDPTGTGKGGDSIYGVVKGKHATFFDDEIVATRKVNKVGLVGMAHTGGREHSNRSQFFITLRGEDMEQFQGNHTIFGEIAEGFDVLEQVNSLYCDEEGRPYQDLRILHSYVLDDPMPDVDGMIVPPGSPERIYPEEEVVKRRIPFGEKLGDEMDGKTEQELDESIRRKEAKSRAIVLEMTGDLPDAEVKPPDEVLFVCKLNPVTTDEDLELIFSRFGPIKSCEVIRDFKTGDSLNYAFIEFETSEACIEAYEKMNNVLIDDRRIKVDFSQSVSKLWNRFLLQPRKDEAAGGGSTSAPLKSVPLPAKQASIYGSGRGNSYNNSASNRSQAESKEDASVATTDGRSLNHGLEQQQRSKSSRWAATSAGGTTTEAAAGGGGDSGRRHKEYRGRDHEREYQRGDRGNDREYGYRRDRTTGSADSSNSNSIIARDTAGKDHGPGYGRGGDSDRRDRGGDNNSRHRDRDRDGDRVGNKGKDSLDRDRGREYERKRDRDRGADDRTDRKEAKEKSYYHQRHNDGHKAEGREKRRDSSRDRYRSSHSTGSSSSSSHQHDVNSRGRKDGKGTGSRGERDRDWSNSSSGGINSTYTDRHDDNTAAGTTSGKRGKEEDSSRGDHKRSKRDDL